MGFRGPLPKNPHFLALFASENTLLRVRLSKNFCQPTYAYFGKFLLNQNYAIMPGVEAIRQQEWLF